MPDIAEIGLSVDSTEVKAATKALNELADAAERAEKAIRALDAARVNVTVHAIGDVSTMKIKGRG